MTPFHSSFPQTFYNILHLYLNALLNVISAEVFYSHDFVFIVHIIKQAQKEKTFLEPAVHNLSVASARWCPDGLFL